VSCVPTSFLAPYLYSLEDRPEPDSLIREWYAVSEQCHLLGRERLPQRMTERATEGVPYAVAVENTAAQVPSVTDGVPLLQGLAPGWMIAGRDSTMRYLNAYR